MRLVAPGSASGETSDERNRIVPSAKKRHPALPGHLRGLPVLIAAECRPHFAERRDAVITSVTGITHITTKQDMSRWTRAHADAPGIRWSVYPGPGGTMIIVEYAEDRCSLNRPDASPDAAPAASFIENPDIARVSA